MPELVDFVIYFHVLFWIYVVFGSFISKVHANFILFCVIPFIYLLHILPHHILKIIEERLLNIENLETKHKDAIIDDRADSIVPCLKYIRYCIKWCDSRTTFSPLSAQGMLILGAIISSRLI
jgi:hypothetical protein